MKYTKVRVICQSRLCKVRILYKELLTYGNFFGEIEGCHPTDDSLSFIL